MRKLFLIALIILLSAATSQAYYSREQIAAAAPVCLLQQPLTVYPATDNARKPDTTLEPGTLVTLEKWLNGGWREISYMHNGMERTGYAHADLKNNGLKFPEVTFVHRAQITGEYGFEGFITITALVDGQEIASHTMAGHGYLDYPIFTVRPGTGLKNAELVLSYYTDPEFCATRYNHFWVWTGQELLPLMTTVHSMDPGGDWYDETTLFPYENGQNNLIMKILFTANEFDDDFNPLDAKYHIDLYEWDGQKLVDKAQNAVVQNWREWDF